MTFNVWTFLFEVINFLVLVSILHWVLYRPLYAAIDRRRAASAKAQADLAQASQKAAALEQQLNARIAAIDQERQDLIRKARDQAEAERKETMAQAERAAEKRRADIASDLERERAEAMQSLRSELVNSAVALAERLLHEASSSTLQEQLSARLFEDLQHIPAGDRERLRGELAADDVAIVETASENNGEIIDRLKSTLESLVGRAVPLTVETRPELLGGVRLRLGGHVWDASYSGVLGEAAGTPPGSAPP